MRHRRLVTSCEGDTLPTALILPQNAILSLRYHTAEARLGLEEFEGLSTFLGHNTHDLLVVEKVEH